MADRGRMRLQTNVPIFSGERSEHDMNDQDNKPDEFKIEYWAEKRRGGWFCVAFGILSLAWTGFDIATNFWEEYWYANVFTTVFGLAFIAYGFREIKKGSRGEKKERGD